jgi:hypothetical protein
LAEGTFVKFFTPYQDGLPSFLSEVAVNQLLMDDNPSSPGKRKRDSNSPTLSSPRMLGYGYYSESSSESAPPPVGEGQGGGGAAAVQWRRPYIITEAVSDVSLSVGLNRLPNQQVDETFLVSLMEGLQCNVLFQVCCRLFYLF